MKRAKHAFKRIHPSIRKPLVFVVGAVVVAAGIAMIVLPGPGWAAIFLGVAILATEFVFAQKIQAWLGARLKKITSRVKFPTRKQP